MTKSLLPPKSTRLERALAECCADIEQVDIPLRHLNNPNTCPEHLLPWLAWSLSVDRWEESWSEAAKRAVINDSWRVHKHKGTISAIRSVVEPMGYMLKIIEWFELDPPGPRGSFALDIAVNEYGITETSYLELERLIDDAKPVSRHMTYLTVQLENVGMIYAASATHLGDVLTVFTPPTGDILTNTPMYLGASTQYADITHINPRA